MEKTKMSSVKSNIPSLPTGRQVLPGKFHQSKSKTGSVWMLPVLIFTIILFVIFAQGCSNQKSNEENVKKISSNKQKEKPGIVKLSDDEIKELRIEVETAKPGFIETHIDLTGEIVTDPTKVAHIIPRFGGVVKEIKKQIGDYVKKDEVIAVIESNESLAPYEVKSLINGTITNMHITPGELIGGNDHKITVADLSSVWAELTLYQKDLPNIKVGQTVELFTGEEKDGVKGQIFYINPTVDEQTRTTKARVRISNISNRWKPGLFVTAKAVISKKLVKLLVKKSALQTLNNKLIVFIQTPDGFKQQEVKPGLENQVNVEIISGLNNGDKYVAEGSFIIKSDLIKDSFGGEE